MTQYDKPPLSLDDQLALLEQRGMIFTDHEEAKHYLQHINYYRLVGYWLPFEPDHTSYRFQPGTYFSQVRYIFDRELRLLLLDAIEWVEISIRTQWAYHLSHRYQDAHAYLNPRNSKRHNWYAKNFSSLECELVRAEETFIEHYTNKYTEPESPPIWAVCEIMSRGS